jgi:glycosyltransferase involved in cell wall biosynthesis
VPLPRVAVVTACYNNASHIEDCVLSVASSLVGRPIQEFEVQQIIVDDGSTDGSQEIIDRLNYSHLTQKYYFDQNTGHPSAVRNYAIKKIDADYIFVLDADDVLTTAGLKYFMDGFQTYSWYQWAYSDFHITGPHLEYWIGHDYLGTPYQPREVILYSLFKLERYFQHSFIFRQDLFEKVGGYDPEIIYGEDLDLVVRFLIDGKIPLHLRHTALVKRSHSGSLTNNHTYTRSVAEYKNHYHKHRTALNKLLQPEQIDELDALYERSDIDFPSGDNPHSPT